MKAASVERYGDIPETAEQLKQESHFYDEIEFADDLDDEASESAPDTESRYESALRAIYDTSVERGMGWVSREQADARLRWYLGMSGAHDSQIDSILERLLSDHLSGERRNGEMFYKVAPEKVSSYYSSGSSAGAGKGPHRSVLRDAYDYFTRSGGCVTII